MDDSDLDFANLCSKLLKRVRKKPNDSQYPNTVEHQSASQSSDGEKRRRNPKKDGVSGRNLAATQPVDRGGGQQEVGRDSGRDSGDAGSSSSSSSSVVSAAGGETMGSPRAKDTVLHRMQQFRRDSPQKMIHKDPIQPRNHDRDCPPFTLQQHADIDALSSGLQPQDSDEVLALRLQQELDREAAQAPMVDLDDGGLFFCQICQKDLSHMTAEGRTQHLNRCLDESEDSALPPPPPPPSSSSLPDCPICGKKFKSQKSRSAHLKRCSSDMGVPPAVLLQALQRQAEERQNTANTHTQTASAKRKAPTKQSLPARKRPRKKPEPLDEETIVALALSSSLQQQERENEAQRLLQPATAESHSSMTPVLKWRQDTGKGRGKRKKGAAPRPPPLLLVQDAQAAVTRLQERVAALLLCSRAPSPPTPTRSPSTVPGWGGAAPLWQKSTLLDGDSTGPSDFYSAELEALFLNPESVMKEVQPLRDNAPVCETGASLLPSSSFSSSSSMTAPSTPGAGQLLVGSQALRDLMELAEDGMTLTQWGDQQISAGQPTNRLRLSGFVQEPEEEGEGAADLCMSGFLPETLHRRSEDHRVRAMSATDQRRGNEGNHKSAALSRLTSDLSSMVNNPQLSDVQLQVDSGEVFFAHSFMVYARCPLLAQMLHESGFGVQEEGVPAAQRVLMNDVPGQAVLALLQFLYMARCSVPASLRPDVLELASRFDLQELQQLCRLHPDEAAALGGEAGPVDQEENVTADTDQAFTELLRSMWNEEEDDGDDGSDSDGGRNEGGRPEEERGADQVTSDDREVSEERVNEEELEEIYEFAATQRKREEKDSEEEEETEERVEDEEGGGKTVFGKPTVDFHVEKLQSSSERHPDPSLDRSYDRLFSESWGGHEDGDHGPAGTASPPSKHHPSPHKLTCERSCRTLLQSSVDNLSLGSPPSLSSLPVPGLSPGPVGGCDGGGDWGEDQSRKRESQGAPQIKKEPELIVLSDSSEEMEVNVALSPSPPSPYVTQNQLSHTEVKPRQDERCPEPAVKAEEPSDWNLSPDYPADCSPEVSWLIPSTPLQPNRSTTSSSTQTRSSMCRARLFSKVHAGPPSSAHCSSSRSSSDVVPVCESKVGRSSSSDRICSPKVSSHDTDVFTPSDLKEALLLSSSRSSLAPFKPTTPRPVLAPPHSSTPLHRDLRQPPVDPPASPLHTRPQERKSPGERSDRSESLERTELGSFHLSPFSEPSDPQSSHGGLQKRRSKSSDQSPSPVESSGGDDGEVELKRKRVANEEKETDCGYKDRDDGDLKENDAAGSSFQNSFLIQDEPPIAFNDSWGLDNNPGCFSLRLEDSGPSGSGQQTSTRSSSSSSFISRQPPPTHAVTPPSPEEGPGSVSSPEPFPGRSSSPPSPEHHNTHATFDKDLLDSKIWDSWQEEGEEEEEEEGEEEEEALPLSQRLNPSAHLKTPKAANKKKRRRTLVPVTPMPHYSDMETPELKIKLNRFGVRRLPKRQMILKLKEIHQYTHQLLSSEDEDERQASGGRPSRPVSNAQTRTFKEPRAPPAPAPVTQTREEGPEEQEEREEEVLSASQGSNTSSTAASEESERSNPELCASSSDHSDSDVSSSQAVSRLQERLRAVRAFILSDAELYSRILHYKPLKLPHFQEQLKAAGIRLGAAKLIDYLDSQCITFTTAKPGQKGGHRGHRGARAGQRGGAKRKKAT